MMGYLLRLPTRARLRRAAVLLATCFLVLLPSRVAFCVEVPAFRITGVAVSEGGGAPVAGCHLTAMRSGQAAAGRNLPRGDGENPSAEADAQGRFTLSLPSAGSWQIYGYARGFRRQGFDRHENFFSAVVLTNASPTYDLRFVLEPDSTVAGFVLDEAGEGVRNARVTLLAGEPPGPDLGDSGGPVRGSTITDDRGHYEFAELAPGDYVVGVQAEPWYAAVGAAGRRFSGENVGDAPTDPVLDVVYPQTYFPGEPDRRSAEVISLHHGESRQADFHLAPIPATHLRIALPSLGPETPQRGQIFPQVERVSNEGNPFVNAAVQVDAHGQIDVGGLSPGLYRVTLRGPSGQQAPSFIRVPGGSARSLDLSSATPVCELSLHFEGGDAARLQVVFRDVDTGATFVSFAQGGLQRRTNGPATEKPAAVGERKLEVPSGQYRVTLNGNNDMYLAGISMKGQTISGRSVSIGSGSVALTLRLAQGRATVQGIVASDGAALRGAMVMLVPATFGQAGSIPILRRDQTNTDGSFLVENVIPGDYILLAIEGGWTVNWRDPSTLAGYLVHGIPLTLGAGATVHQDLVAQRP